MRDLPRQLTADELAELFEGRTRLVERLAARDDPLRAADAVVAELSDDELKEALDAHPAIGARREQLSARSAAEQGEDADPETLAELERLNREYEQRFGFRFVTFVNRRPKAQVLEELRERIERPREEELRRAAHELVAIARDRWTRG
ncbi:MAG TPA: 2-oxo-4-hydroxy-4-carboxy-5-ureidoimidazoline decarboxylase [Gaiellaceae bacterium]|nr:2-oxo-4-hydroxy-4-carboxy-5-ureidoimidazoline decarboxylase [Gaiellaceae bacterium]